MKVKLLKQFLFVPKQMFYIFLLQVLMLQFTHAAQSKEQNIVQTKVSMNLRKAALTEILSEIEKQTNFVFMYDVDILSNNQKSSVNFKDRSVAEVLEEIGNDYRLDFKQINNTIYVRKNEPGSQNSNPASIHQSSRIITGKVSDKEGNTLPGVSVSVKGTSLGTITAADGSYRLSLKENDKALVFTFIGMKPLEVSVNDKNTLDVSLEDESINLDEIVAVGYGTQKKVNLTGAVEQVNSKVFENRSVSNVTQALQGVIPNLNITLEDGKPTRSSSFNVRGTTSIGQGGSSLVLIDGVEGDPSLLNPNDIASVSVLKDAASAAIYGARGSFGVVLITTKSPTKGKTVVNYTGNFSVQAPTATPNYVTDGVSWAEHFRESYYNYNKSIPTSINNGIQGYSDEWLATFKERKAQGITDEAVKNADGSYTYYGNTDWYDRLYKDHTLAQDHNISVSGGTEKSDFYLSGRFYKYGGLYNYNPDDYQSSTFRGKGSLQIFDWLKANNNMEFSNTDYHNPYVASYSYTIQRYIELAAFPTMPVFNPDGTYTRSTGYTIGSLMDKKNAQDTNNKMFRNTLNFSSQFFHNRLRINGDFTVRYKTVGQDRKRVKVSFNEKENVTSSVGSFNDYAVTSANTSYTAANLYSEYENTFVGKHYFKGMVGFNHELSRYKDLQVQRNGLLLEDAETINLALGESTTTSANITRWQVAGMFFRLNYGFKDRYLVEVNGRYDGSSKFPANQQWGFFPSVSAGWRISEEPFWKISKNILSDMKIRASYGSLGNGNVSPYSFMELLAISTSGRVLNGALNKYTSNPSVIPNGLTWETATTLDFGLDFGSLNGKLKFTGDAYSRKTTNMYTVGVTLPDVFGATSPKGNYADMTTNGWEISVSYKDKFLLANKRFDWEVRGSMYDYYSTIDRYNNSTKSLSDYYQGMRIGEVWGYKTNGLFQNASDLTGYQNTIVKATIDGIWQVGDLRFVDLSKNGKIDYGDNTVDKPGDKRIIGNTEPRYNYSFSVKTDWNNFFFSAFFQGVGRQNWFPSAESSFWGQYNRPYNSLPQWHINNYWTAETPNAYLPRYSTYNGTLGWSGVKTDRYLQNVAYVRLKNIQFGYNLPEKWLSKIKISSSRLYLSGENLWCWSPLYKRTKDFDVSNATSGKDSDLSSNAMGDGNSYPLMKSVSLGLSVTF